jgi:hypothetical protein
VSPGGPGRGGQPGGGSGSGSFCAGGVAVSLAGGCLLLGVVVVGKQLGWASGGMQSHAYMLLAVHGCPCLMASFVKWRSAYITVQTSCKWLECRCFAGAWPRLAEFLGAWSLLDMASQLEIWGMPVIDGFRL